MCYLCNNERLEKLGEIAVVLYLMELDNPSFKSLTFDQRMFPEKEGITGETYRYVSLKKIMMILTSKKFINSRFLVEKDTVCKEHKFMLISLIRGNYVVPVLSGGESKVRFTDFLM